MESIGQRVRRLRERRGWSVHELARQTGGKVSYQSLQQLEAGGVQQPRYLQHLAGPLETSLNFLVTGKQDGATKPVAAFAVREWSDGEDLDATQDVMIPVYEIELSQGPGGRVVPEYVETKHQLPYSHSWLRRKRAKAADCKAFPVRGDSMLPTLADGDLVLVNTAEKRIVDGKIYAIIVGDEPKLKRLKRKADGSLVIISDNAAFDAEIIPVTEADSVYIIGRAINRSGDL